MILFPRFNPHMLLSRACNALHVFPHTLCFLRQPHATCFPELPSCYTFSWAWQMICGFVTSVIVFLRCLQCNVWCGDVILDFWRQSLQNHFVFRKSQWALFCPGRLHNKKFQVHFCTQRRGGSVTGSSRLGLVEDECWGCGRLDAWWLLGTATGWGNLILLGPVVQSEEYRFSPNKSLSRG